MIDNQARGFNVSLEFIDSADPILWPSPVQPKTRSAECPGLNVEIDRLGIAFLNGLVYWELFSSYSQWSSLYYNLDFILELGLSPPRLRIRSRIYFSTFSIHTDLMDQHGPCRVRAGVLPPIYPRRTSRRGMHSAMKDRSAGITPNVSMRLNSANKRAVNHFVRNVECRWKCILRLPSVVPSRLRNVACLYEVSWLALKDHTPQTAVGALILGEILGSVVRLQ
jgi:hypothetical protein